MLLSCHVTKPRSTLSCSTYSFTFSHNETRTTTVILLASTDKATDDIDYIEQTLHHLIQTIKLSPLLYCVHAR